MNAILQRRAPDRESRGFRPEDSRARGTVVAPNKTPFEKTLGGAIGALFQKYTRTMAFGSDSARRAEL